MRIGSYELLEPIQKGGMGAVWRAVRLSDRSPAALKVLLHAEPHDPEPGSRPASPREALVVSGLRHEGLLEIHDSGFTKLASGRWHGYVVTALVRGARHLDVWAAEQSAEEVLAKLEELVAAIRAVHDFRVSHFDLKPANILVGEDGRLAVADFGVARNDAAWARERIGGTPRFMAPEQLKSPESASYPADIYAIGRMLQDWIASRSMPGRPGFRDDEIDMLRPALTAIASACLRREPSRRPTINELAAAIRRCRQPWRPTMIVHRAWSHAPRLIRGAVALAAAPLVWIAAIACTIAVSLVSTAPAVGFDRAVAFLAPAYQGEAFEYVWVAGMTTEQAADIADRLGLGDVDPQRPASMREVWAEIVRQARLAGARSITLDLFLTDPGPATSESASPAAEPTARGALSLEREARAMEATGRTLIVPTSTWYLSPESLERDEPVAARLRDNGATLGGATTRPITGDIARVDLAVANLDRTFGFMTSVAVHTARRFVGGGDVRDVPNWNGGEDTPVFLATPGTRDPVRPSRTIDGAAANAPIPGLPGDRERIAQLDVAIPNPRTRDASTFDAAELLSPDPVVRDRARRRVDGRSLILTDLRRDQRLAQTEVPGAFVLGATVESLVGDHRVVRLGASNYLLVLLGAVAGIGLGTVWRRRRRARTPSSVGKTALEVLGVGLVTAGITIAIGWIFRVLGDVWMLSVPIWLALLVGACIAAFAPRLGPVLAGVFQDRSIRRRLRRGDATAGVVAAM